MQKVAALHVLWFIADLIGVLEVMALHFCGFSPAREQTPGAE